MLLSVQKNGRQGCSATQISREGFDVRKVIKCYSNKLTIQF